MIRKNLIKIIGLFVLSFAFIPNADAATLFFAPSSGTYYVGSTLSVGINVGSYDQAMNATSGVVLYPPNTLELVSLSKVSSIISLWVKEPAYSNAAGTAEFEGIVLNPGFTGSSGRVLTLNFRVKAAGTAQVSFSKGDVLANDGKGSNILSSLGTANFTLARAPVAANPPNTPKVSSPTHPDQAKWYAENSAEFDWVMPADATGASVLLDKNPGGAPEAKSIGYHNSYTFNDIDEGISYFHVRLQNKDGWSDTGTFKVQVDTEKPTKFEITEIPRDDATNPNVKLKFTAEDQTSGIDHYEIQIDSIPTPEIWLDKGDHIYAVKPVDPGDHKLFAKAVDKAGNYLTSYVAFHVDALEPPVITEYPTEIVSGQTLTIKGKTKYAGAKIIVYLQKGNDEPKVGSTYADDGGAFTFANSDTLPDGVYKAWAIVQDDRGAKSGPSKTVTISVQKTAIVRIGDFLIQLLAIIIPLIALIFALVMMVLYTYKKYRDFRDKIMGEVTDMEKEMHKEFDKLKDDVKEQIKMLEDVKTRRQLTKEEQRIISQLKSDIGETEEIIVKDIRKIEKDIG